jgi:hypothetical protein
MTDETPGSIERLWFFWNIVVSELHAVSEPTGAPRRNIRVHPYDDTAMPIIRKKTATALYPGGPSVKQPTSSGPAVPSP